MNVLSLFNGMNTGRIALDNVGIEVGKYYSSEIKKYAIELTQHHHPDTIQLGDVNNWKEWDIDWSSIDLVISGSPCQDLSIAGRRKGLKGERSGLFFTVVEIIEKIKLLNPDVKFFQENVGSAPKEDVRIMSEALGVLPVRFNSSLVTAQLRDRYYWSNIKTREDWTGYVWTDFEEPKDRGIMFKDIIEDGYTDQEKGFCLLESEERVTKNQKSLEKRNKKAFVNIVYIEKEEVRVKTNTNKGYDVLTPNDCLNLSFPTSETRSGRVTKGKSPCLLEGNEPLYTLNTENYTLRTLTKIELCRLQGFPDHWCDIVSRNKAASLLGDGWTLPMVEHFFKHLK